MSEIRIGIFGWRYSPWRKDFHPKGLRQGMTEPGVVAEVTL